MTEETYEWPIDNTGLFTDIFNLSGRISRKEYVIYMVGGLIVGIIDSFIPYMQLLFNILLLIWSIGFLSESVKRMHDFDVTGKWIFAILLLHILSYFAPLVSLVLEIILLIILYSIFLMLAICPGTDGINRYGSNPIRSYREQTLEAGFPDLDDD